MTAVRCSEEIIGLVQAAFFSGGLGEELVENVDITHFGVNIDKTLFFGDAGRISLLTFHLEVELGM